MTNTTTQTENAPLLIAAQPRASMRATRVARHWIDGQWRDSADHRDSIDPASGEKIGVYALGKEAEAADAVAAAVRAFRDTDWKTNRELRVRVLNEMADRFEARTAELAQAIAAENGKILPEAMFEVAFAAPGLRYGATLVSAHYGRAAEWEAGRMSLLLREAVGVAGISVPWNAPVALLIRSLAPALAAGCTVVVKMPGETAQMNALVSEVMSEVKSLPPGVINMVTGGREVLSYLVESPDVPTISFTGSTRTGRAISAAGASRLKRFNLELGGKTPLIVFDDADLDVALPKIEKALTVFAGQFCMTGSRLLVQAGIADELRRRLGERLAKVKVGPASDPESEMGPLIDRANVERVEQRWSRGHRRGREGHRARRSDCRRAVGQGRLLPTDPARSRGPADADRAAGGVRASADDAGLRHRSRCDRACK